MSLSRAIGVLLMGVLGAYLVTAAAYPRLSMTRGLFWWHGKNEASRVAAAVAGCLFLAAGIYFTIAR